MRGFAKKPQKYKWHKAHIAPSIEEVRDDALDVKMVKELGLHGARHVIRYK
jgi:hypothetical protein